MRVGLRRCAPAALAALALLLTSCGGDSDAATTSAAPTASSAPSATASPGASTQRAAVAEPKAESAAADLANFTCGRRESGAWRATGVITNSASDAMIYTLTVATVRGADQVSGEKVKEFVLRPDESTAFELPRFTFGSADTCMPRLLRTPR
ncbi:MAG: hypothetical protein ACRDOJ_09050 [Nocardioidaceae bacterium]